MRLTNHGRRIIVVGVFLILSACAAGPPQPSQSEVDASNALAEYTESMQLITEFKKRRGSDCESSLMRRAKHKADMIDARTIKYYRGLNDPYRYSNVQKQVFLDTIQTINPMAIDASFNVADAFLEANCLDKADEIYRDILSTYTGKSFVSARERARVGIDDVRSRRRD